MLSIGLGVPMLKFSTFCTTSCFCFQKTSKLDKETGLNTVKYEVVRHELVIDHAPVTMFEVKLNCDYGKTPWCLKAEDHHLLQATPAPPNLDVPKIPDKNQN